MTLEVIDLNIPDVKLIKPKRFSDSRGYFVETYNKRTFGEAGVAVEFVQDNCSLSVETGTVRALHYQIAPYAQDKLVRVVKGEIFDVAVDLRRSSPTFGHSVSATLTAEGGEQLFVPAGFAHGFCTLVPNTEVIYKVSQFYAPHHERGICWNDAALAIRWPVTEADAHLLDKDKRHPRLDEQPDLFE